MNFVDDNLNFINGENFEFIYCRLEDCGSHVMWKLVEKISYFKVIISLFWLVIDCQQEARRFP